MFKNYAKIAIRNLLKYKIYSFINIIGLAVGMACVIIIMFWVLDELSYDRFHKHSEQIYQIIQENKRYPKDSDYAEEDIPNASTPVLVQNIPEILNAVRMYDRENCLVRYNDTKYYEDKLYLVDPSFFTIFSFPLVIGEPNQILSNKQNIVISERISQKYFGRDNPVGKVLTFNDNDMFTVSGVMKNIPYNSSIKGDFFISIQNFDNRDRWFLQCEGFLLMQKQANPEIIEQKIDEVLKNYRTDSGYKMSLRPLYQIHLYRELGEKGRIIYVYIFTSIALFILVIVCLNYINLSTALSTKRTKEIGLKKVIGADKIQIITQFLTESILYVFMALISSLVLIEIVIFCFDTPLGKYHVYDYMDLKATGGLLAIVFITGIAAGAYPAFSFADLHPIQIFKKHFDFRKRSNWTRNSLIIIQFSISIFLIISTIIISKQVRYIQKMNSAIIEEPVLVIPLNSSYRANYTTIKNKLIQNTQIKNVTTATSLPVNIGNFNPVTWEGKSSQTTLDRPMYYVSVDYDYIETFNIQFVDGRNFSKQYALDESNYILNEKAVQTLQIESPIGKRFTMNDKQGRIIGVVKDFHFNSLHNEIEPLVITMAHFMDKRYMFIQILPERISQQIQFIKYTIEDVSPDFPVQYFFLDESVEELYRFEKQVHFNLELFTMISIFVSCLGLLGLVVFTIEQSVKEIGIRKVLGASVFTIISWLIQPFAKCIFAANLFAWPFAYYALNKWLQNFAYRIDMTIWPFVIAGTAALTIALMTVSWLAIRAATANPVDALRYE
ncbi:MAG TPA: ABC transporter permease [Balneolaceae bacterium]|nr:ABC transporter permease [Balneolaceae bacterium]